MKIFIKIIDIVLIGMLIMLTTFLTIGVIIGFIWNDLEILLKNGICLVCVASLIVLTFFITAYIKAVFDDEEKK